MDSNVDFKLSKYDDGKCPICMDICINDKVNKALLPCGHVFCYECIDGVRKVKRQCPVCREEFNKISYDFRTEVNFLTFYPPLNGREKYVTDELNWIEVRSGIYLNEQERQIVIQQLGETYDLFIANRQLLDVNKAFQFGPFLPPSRQPIDCFNFIAGNAPPAPDNIFRFSAANTGIDFGEMKSDFQMQLDLGEHAATKSPR